MQTGTPAVYWIIGIVVIIAIVVIAIAASRRARSSQLQRRFGPEYDRTVQTTGDRAAAERELADREKRVKKLKIVDLPDGAKARYAEEWRTIQARFVDDPNNSLNDADRLVGSVMRDRGYPMDDFDQQVADLSPDHPIVVDNYRSAHAIAERNAAGDASTEDLRQAMVHYRTLFEDLLGTSARSTA